MELNKINTIGLIQRFLKSTSSKNLVFELNRYNLIYFIYRGLDEDSTKVVILKEEWIPLKKRYDWIRRYLLIQNDFRINRKSINDWIQMNESLEIEESIDIKIIDLSLESKKAFKALLYETNKNKKMKFIVEDYLSGKFVISPNAKSNSNITYQKVINRGLFNKSKTKKIGVISPFTYGKSALINSLLQLDLLQEDILVKTAKITTITHNEDYWLMKEDPTLIIENYLDESNFKERLGYLSTLNEKGSNLVDTTINNTELKLITFVDTPGLFGKNPEHDEITGGIIEKLDYIMYLLNPTQLGFEPYTKKILEWQHKYQKPCIFVMNKMDLVKTLEDRNSLREEFNKTLGQKVKHNGIFYVSAYSALKARLYKKKEIDLLTLKKDPFIFVTDGEWVISGRSFTEEHIDRLEESSCILELERFIKSI
ncbi:dynamin family protein [Cytobacillus sp. S13-E01]|uniref:dynamin family protein n=1 Tax=Cytobacillus sp. S13-E01 TaxID=3031326 RepID=UPI0023D86C55|nr:dynamin family protein [Cytobacillus sp. S13-E01]MDF0728890.1 dynamin family protein [Cytobacillus sp. S13-E01]